MLQYIANQLVDQLTELYTTVLASGQWKHIKEVAGCSRYTYEMKQILMLEEKDGSESTSKTPGQNLLNRIKPMTIPVFLNDICAKIVVQMESNMLANLGICE